MSLSFTNSVPLSTSSARRAKGKPTRMRLKCLYHEAAFSNYERRRFGPSAGDIRQHQAVHIATAVNFPAMSHQIHFHAARRCSKAGNRMGSNAFRRLPQHDQKLPIARSVQRVRPHHRATAADVFDAALERADRSIAG